MPSIPTLVEHSPLLSVPELSAYLGIKSKTLYAKIGAGEIPHYRIGRLIRFRLDEINGWLEGCKNSKAPAVEPRVIKARKTISRKSSGFISTIIAKTIDGEKEKYYSSNHGKSDRIEGLGKEADNGII
jgi:excisionase family DNA binding protein